VEGHEAGSPERGQGGRRPDLSSGGRKKGFLKEKGSGLTGQKDEQGLVEKEFKARLARFISSQKTPGLGDVI